LSGGNLVEASGEARCYKLRLEVRCEPSGERAKNKSRSTASSLFEQLPLAPHSSNRSRASWKSSSTTTNSAGFHSSTERSLVLSPRPHHFFPLPDPSQHLTTPHGELPNRDRHAASATMPSSAFPAQEAQSTSSGAGNDVSRGAFALLATASRPRMLSNTAS
jgi:hypothetical protein